MRTHCRIANLFALAFGLLLYVTVIATVPAAEQPTQAESKAAASTIDGRELFVREWLPGDSRSHGGDGLGPMFNESSCVACHNLGGVGGGGPASKNVNIITAFRNRGQQQAHVQRQPRTLPQAIFRSIFGQLDPVQPQSETKVSAEELAAQRLAQQKQDREVLTKMHPGFRGATSVVLHHNGTYDGYAKWRMRMGGFHFGNAPQDIDVQFFGPDVTANKALASRQRNAGQQLMQQLRSQVQMSQHRSRNASTQVGKFAVVRSQRNTTALFGAGLIDSIPVAVLEELEKEQLENRDISGRVARLKDGKAGRFGWKAQTPSLSDFVLTACAVELGLNVPEHPQAGVPHKPDYQPKALDLNEQECNALISYIADLPAPTQRKSPNAKDTKFVDEGSELFASVGCAACHVPEVGEVAGIYSDLLLHDLGNDLGDTGSYGVFVPNSTPEGQEVPIPLAGARSAGNPQQQVIGATRLEWRTPPLWGVRDSAPYLHDGRAETLEQAIAMHGGEGERSKQKFFSLPANDRFKVIAFLNSLAAPDQVVVAGK